MEQIIRIGMDTSKHVFQLHGVNAAEEPVLRKKRPAAAEAASPRDRTTAAGAPSDGIRLRLDRDYRRRQLLEKRHRLLAPQRTGSSPRGPA